MWGGRSEVTGPRTARRLSRARSSSAACVLRLWTSCDIPLPEAGGTSCEEELSTAVVIVDWAIVEATIGEAVIGEGAGSSTMTAGVAAGCGGCRLTPVIWTGTGPRGAWNEIGDGGRRSGSEAGVAG